MATTEVEPVRASPLRWLKSLSPFARVNVGLGLGIFVGLFFGEGAGVLEIWGQAYIGLLQMTVLPYIVVSLIGGLGRLNAAIARRIGLMGGGLILLVWGLAQASNVFLSLAYPDWTTASFFSTSLVEPAKPFDVLQLYIPSNPFYSLANAIVPAVVVFSILLGLALIAVPDKKEVLASFDTLGTALMRVASFIIRLAPLGIFAIAGAAAGTLRHEELSRIEVYVWTYLATWGVITFWTLPILVAWATPLSYREVLREARLPMITAFATGTVLVVLPMIAERCKQVLEKHGMTSRDTDSTIDVMVPTVYSFPSAGTILGLGFIVFAAWYSGTPLGPGDFAGFIAVGTFVAFGSMSVAIPFLLDFFSLSADLFQLYLIGGVIAPRFSTSLAAMHGIALALLCAFAVAGRLRVQRLFQAALAGMAVAAGVALLLGVVLTRTIDYRYSGDEEFVARSLVKERVPVTQIEDVAELEPADLSRTRLEVIQERGSLRVVYLSDGLPFAYRNSEGEIVGYDMDLLQTLASDLGVELELIRLDWETAVAALDEGRVDVAAGGLTVTPSLATQVSFSHSYMDQSAAFVVLDGDRDEFADFDDVRAMEDLTILIMPDAYYRDVVEDGFPKARVATLDSPQRYLEGETGDGVLLHSAEAGSAWTLIYPDYSVVVPQGMRMKVPTALGLPRGDLQFVAYINTWLDIAKKDGLQDTLFSNWVLGEAPTAETPRWSILHNVLGWGSADDEPEG